jgi:hypothetical protein
MALAVSALGCASSPGVADAGAERAESPPAWLTQLEVESSASPTLALVPPFSPEVHDYYVRCPSTTNALTVSMMASAGALSSLARPTSKANAAPALKTSVVVGANRAIVAVATAGHTRTEYWVRCLPADFPPMRWTAHPEAGTPPPGYYLVGNNASPSPSYAGYAMVLNGMGVPVWYSHGESKPGAVEPWVAWDVDSLSPGTVSYFAPYGSPVETHDLASRKTTFAAPARIARDSHELRRLSNGHLLVISAPVERANLTGLEVPLTDGGSLSFGPGSRLDGCDLAEFDPQTGDLVWTWSASNHLDPVKDATAPQVNKNSKPGKPVAETFHCNSIDVDETTGNILLSARDMDSVFYIERRSGKILWKMGGATYTKDDATYVHVNDPFHRQHDARFQPGWSSTCAGGRGRISLFDDHSDLPGPARAVVLDVVVGRGSSADCDGGPPAAPGATLVWQYAGETSSAGEGSFRISPDGSRVVGWGQTGTPGLVMTEVDEGKADLVDLYFTDGDTSYRAIKVPSSTFDLSVLRETAGLP